jgi:subtilisin family serine protease
LTAAVQRQVTGLALLPYQPAVRHQLLELLLDRRKGHDNATQFAYLPAAVGFDALLVRDQLLITRESYERARTYLHALNLVGEDVNCSHLRRFVKRLTRPGGISAQELANTASNLRMQGFSASLTNITPTAGVHKHPPSSPVTNPGGRLTRTDVRYVAERRSRAMRQDLKTRGTPAKVAIIDTGITDQRRTDGWLTSIDRNESNIDHLHQFPLGNTPEDRAQREQYLDFDAGHGTFGAGIVQQIAPHAEIKVYRAVDSDGIGSEVDVACAMIQAVQDGNQIINLSLGCQTQDDFPPIAIQAALDIIRDWERKEKEEDQRAVIVAAAGNFGDTRPSWPAAFRDVVAVAALAPDMQQTPWSSHGFWITCSTVGQGILSTFVVGTEAPEIGSAAYTFNRPNPWAVWSGTSFAAPQITGALAWQVQFRAASPRQALDTVLAEGRPIPDFGQAVHILPGH